MTYLDPIELIGEGWGGGVSPEGWNDATHAEGMLILRLMRLGNILRDFACESALLVTLAYFFAAKTPILAAFDREW